MGVIDLNARVKALEHLDRSYYPEEFDQLSAEVTAIDNQINGDGGIDDTVTALGTTVTSLGTTVTALNAYAKTTIELPEGLTAEADYGGCYLESIGKLRHAHVALSGVTANTNTTIVAIASGDRPDGQVYAIGLAGAIADGHTCAAFVSNNIIVRSPDSMVRFDLWWCAKQS